MTEKEYNQQENICILYIWQRIAILNMKNYYKTLTHIHRKMSRKTSPVYVEDKPNGTWEHKQLRLTRNQESANDKSTEMILQPSGIAKSGKYQNPSPGEATDTVWNNIQLWQWVSLREYLTIPDNTGEPWKYDAKQIYHKIYTAWCHVYKNTVSCFKTPPHCLWIRLCVWIR